MIWYLRLSLYVRYKYLLKPMLFIRHFLSFSDDLLFPRCFQKEVTIRRQLWYVKCEMNKTKHRMWFRENNKLKSKPSINKVVYNIVEFIIDFCQLNLFRLKQFQLKIKICKTKLNVLIFLKVNLINPSNSNHIRHVLCSLCDMVRLRAKEF